MTVATVKTSAGEIKLGCLLPIQQAVTDKFVLSEYSDGSHKLSLRLNHYYDPRLAASPPPSSTNWSERAMPSLRRMYKNDQLGCCVISDCYHQVGLWSANDTTQSSNPECLVGTDDEVVSTYRVFNPGSQDNGCVVTQVADYLRTHGLVVGGKVYKIDGYVAVDWTNQLMVQVALAVFGSIKLAVQLPQDWASSPDNGTWDVTNSPVVGGHDIPAVDYDRDGVWISTWGGLRLFTWKAFLSRRYIVEAYVPLSPNWYGSDLLAANGINKAELADDLVKIGQGIIPDPGPGGGPPPGPTPPTPPRPTPPSAADVITVTRPIQPGESVRFATGKNKGVYLRSSQAVPEKVQTGEEAEVE